MTEAFYIVTRAGRTGSLPIGKSTVALGTFDGVHLAHQRVLKEAIALKESLGADLAGAWCFSSLPTAELTEKRIVLLCSFEERIKRMLDFGLDFVAVGDFKALSQTDAEVFIDSILINKLNCVGVVCGFNHRFGRKGLGTPELLSSRFGETHTRVVPEVRLLGETVSSTSIREHITNGKLDVALKMLSHPITLSARVIGGKHLGHTIGYPTANQLFREDIITPARGIYATLCYTDDGKRYIGVSNVGIRPTITDGTDDHVVNCETYICNFNKDIYGKMLTVSFRYYLREERKFSSIKELCDQIGKDAKEAIRLFGEEGILP